MEKMKVRIKNQLRKENFNPLSNNKFFDDEYFRYESITSFFNAQPQKHNAGLLADIFRQNGRHGPQFREWYGVNSIRDVLNLQRGGWPEGVTRLKAFQKKLKTKLPPVRRTRKTKVWGNNGGYCDLGQVMKGRINTAWVRSKPAAGSKKKQKAPIVPILVEVGGPCTLSQNQLFWGPATALVLCEYLQSLRYSVEISTYQQVASLPVGSPGCGIFGNTTDDSPLFTVRTFVKQAHQSMNLKNLAIVACAAFPRYYGFKAKSRSKYPMVENLGSCMFPAEYIEDRRDMIQPVFLTRITSEYKAIAFIQECLGDFLNEDLDIIGHEGKLY